MEKTTPMRRVPQQARSQKRVDTILDAASDLFAEEGYDSATTNAIAEQAGISIGSLYRYFPDKTAILNALATRHQQQVHELYERIFTPDLVYLPLPVALDRLIDPFVEMHTTCPVYKYILLGADISSDVASASEAMDQEVIRRIAEFLKIKAPTLDEEQAYTMAVVCKAVVKALISLLGSLPEGKKKAPISAEVKHMLRGYLQPYFTSP